MTLTSQIDLLGIGLIGSVQNLLAAGITREPSALGIHLKYKDEIKAERVSLVLKEAEEKYPGIGISLINVFFPGGFRVIDKDFGFWREAYDARYSPNDYGALIDRIPLANSEAS